MSNSRPGSLSALDHLIDVTDWRPDENFPVYPVGAKPKRLLVCPEPAPHPLLIAGHTYLFKVAEAWKARQIWSEAIAFQIASSVGIDVPACYMARNNSTGQSGALIEFFLGYPGEASPSRLLHGADLLQERGFTAGGERPHNLADNISLCSGRGIDGAANWWAETVTFDALIGNTDRHAENWGLLSNADGSERFAPRFDNGTSLAYAVEEDGLERLLADEALDRFIDKGRGHLGIDSQNDRATPLVEMVRHAGTLDGTGEVIRNVIHADLSFLGGVLEACTHIGAEPAFTPRRGELILKLVKRRQTRLIEACGG